jgi:hypothetical protein
LQNQGGLVDLFPAWYQKSRSTSLAKNRSTAEDTSSSSSWTYFPTSPGPTFLPEEVHKNGLQAQQNQERGPIGPIGPTLHTIVPLRATPHAEGGVLLTGTTSASLPTGDIPAVPMAPGIQAPEAVGRCYMCTGSMFWTNTGGQRVCATCHPRPMLNAGDMGL